MFNVRLFDRRQRRQLRGPNSLPIVLQTFSARDDDIRRRLVEQPAPKQRAAILGELREMPFDQIVELLGTSRSAAYKMLHDARCALKQRLHEAGITGVDIQNAFNL